MSRAVVEKWYWALGIYQRNMPLLPLGRTFYTPNQVISEVQRGTNLGRDLQSQLEALRGVGSARLAPALLWDLAKMRIIQTFTEMPMNLYLRSLTQPVLSAEQVIKEVIAETPTGKQLIRAEIEIVKRLWKV